MLISHRGTIGRRVGDGVMGAAGECINAHSDTVELSREMLSLSDPDAVRSFKLLLLSSILHGGRMRVLHTSGYDLSA